MNGVFGILLLFEELAFSTFCGMKKMYDESINHATVY